MWRKSFDWTRSSNKRKCDQFFSSHLKALIKMLNTTHFQQFASFEWSVRSWLTASDFTPTCSADSVCAAKNLTRLTEQIHCAQRFCLFYQLKWKSIKCSLNANTQNKQNPALRPKSTRCIHAVAYIHMYGCSLTRIKYHCYLFLHVQYLLSFFLLLVSDPDIVYQLATLWHTRGTVLVAWKSANLGHHLHQGLHILHYGALKL